MQVQGHKYLPVAKATDSPEELSSQRIRLITEANPRVRMNAPFPFGAIQQILWIRK